MEKYYGNYRGIVINNSDPKGKNRVKVFVPQISTTLLKEVSFEKKDISFKSLGTNLEDSLPDEVVKLIEPLLPWAEYASPLFGGGSSTHYNPQTSIATNTTGTAATPPTGSGTGNYASLGVISSAPSNVQSNTGTSAVSGYFGTDVSKDRGSILVNDKGRVSPASLRSYLESRLQSSSLKDFKPADGATYGIDGSASSWANYFTKLAEHESGFKLREVNTSDPGGVGGIPGSVGIYQISSLDGKRYGANPTGNNWTYAELLDPINQVETVIKIHEKRVLESGRVVNPITGKGAGGYYARTTMDKISADAKAGRMGKFDPNAPVSAPQSQYRPYDPLARLTGSSTPMNGIPGGMFSTPMVGSHVWVFFEGGDPMYPVYFAYHIVSEDMSRINQVSSPPGGDISTQTERYQYSHIVQPGAGCIKLGTQVRHDSLEGDISESGLYISTDGGGLFQMADSGTLEYSPIRKSTTVAGNEFHTVWGDNSEYIAGDNNVIVNEAFTLNIGKLDEEAKQAASDIYSVLEPIHERRRRNVIPTGTAPCPNCNRTILSTKGDSLISSVLRVAGKAVDKLLPRKGVAADFIKEILSVSLKPIKSGKQKTLMDSSSCGPGCTNHTVPTYTGSNADRSDNTYIDSISAAQNKIIDLEKKTGYGGDFKINVAKNASLVVGLAPNKLEPFREIPNLQVLAGVKMYSGTGAFGFQTENIKQYEPLEMVTPDLGNYDMLIGNKLSITAGAGGVFMETTGQVNLHGGTIEMTGNTIVLGNNSGVTKVNGAALQIHSTSIQLGEASSNVHVMGSMHCAANLNTMGGIYTQGGLAAPSIDVPYQVAKTSTSTKADYAGESAKWITTGGPVLKGLSAGWKSVLHYGNPGQIGYLATVAGIQDLITEYMSLIMVSIPVDGFTGIGVCAVGPVIVFNFPHLHPSSVNAHYHSYERPRGVKLGGSDKVGEHFALNGTAVPNIVGLV